MSTQKKLSFKKAAVIVLKDENEPLSAKQITEYAIQRDLISTDGKTPDATMAAQLYVDIKKNIKTKFKKVGRGKFTLKEQQESPNTPLLLIDNQNKLVRKTLMEKLQDMDPYQFEFLVADLLKEIGYEDVEVTKRSGDKGIDVVANLTMDGITNVKTIIQVKRYKEGNNIAGRVVTQLRGSAEVDQRGMVITTSDFTKDAVEEAKASNKMPVSLINGEKLINLLFRYGVGLKKDDVILYSIDNEYFENAEEENDKPSDSNKSRGLWPLPGGINSYVETLFEFLQQIDTKVQTKKELTKWILSKYENVQSEKTAYGYINVPRAMGLTTTQEGKVTLSQIGRDILVSRDIDSLYETISDNVLAFDDVVEYLKSSDSPQSEQDILDFLSENFDISWTTFAQVNYRLLWLVNLGKIEKTDTGFIAK